MVFNAVRNTEYIEIKTFANQKQAKWPLSALQHLVIKNKLCTFTTEFITTTVAMNYTKLILCFLLVICCNLTVTAGVSADNQKLYQQLDSLIDHQSDFINQKKARIKVITDGMAVMKLSNEQQYQLYMKLYDEYLAFQFDSAFYYNKRCMELQKEFANPDMSAKSRIRMAHILAVSGIFQKAKQMLDSIRPQQLSPVLQVEYYNQLGELNLYRSEMAAFTPFFQEYLDSTQYYRQMILQIAPHNSYDYIFNHATYLCEQGKVQQAIKQLESYLPKLNKDERTYSIITSTLAYFYSTQNNGDMREYYLLLSAISDVRGAILENNSLRELSAILLERGEYTRAYNYLQQASKDAENYGSKLRSLQVARMAPLITQAYDMERTATEQRTRMLLIVISVIALLLSLTIFYILRLVQKRRIANEQIHTMNAELTQRNQEMQQMNAQMKESNRIKDEYIGRFLQLSSNIINISEEHVKQQKRLARDRKIEELYAELKDPKHISEGIRLFHQNFDTAFLNIYPNFIEEVNHLMTDDNQFDISPDTDRLTTELRVLALIRLGINDNQNIADILRSSIATIYTYRSKLKARARSKTTFEDDVRKIATY